MNIILFKWNLYLYFKMQEKYVRQEEKHNIKNLKNLEYLEN